MARPVYIAGVGLTKVDLTGRVFASVFDLFAEAYEKALEDSRVRAFDAVQVGIMDSEEFENRANIAAKAADRLGLRGVPAVRSETASSTGAAAFHEAWYKVASEQCDSVLVLAGERMKTVTTEAATAIMSKVVDPVERRFGCTMPGLIALVTGAWLRERGIGRGRAARIFAHLMHRAHALGAANPLAAFHGRPEPLEAYFDAEKNLPVATPLLRKDCSPICDGAAAVILTARPEAVRVAGLGSATDSSSILDRRSLTRLDATREAAAVAWWRAGVTEPRELEGLVVEAHDAFNSLLPMDLVDLGLVEPDEAVAALIREAEEGSAPPDPRTHPVTGVGGRIPTNLSGGLKARGHPVGGTGLFQIAEGYLQLTERFPNPAAQVRDARMALAHSIGGPGNNNYVTLLERADSRRTRRAGPEPRRRFRSEPGGRRRTPRPPPGSRAVVEAATTIHVTAGDVPGPVHVAIVRLDGGRMFARLEHEAGEEEPTEEVLAGRRVKLLVKDDGDHYFQLDRGRSGLGGLLERVRSRIGIAPPAGEPAGGAEPDEEGEGEPSTSG
ncbi:MAG: beta-ketoacyl synthase N-terminal-like domain-containing protein [Myxococcota bacterium]|nr:beta-ketoacyl synthase N-terminal-like domain-containing protein [Myxococcota bacterium]